MARCLDRKERVLARRAEFLRLVDDVPVAPFVSVMFEPQFALEKLMQFVRCDAVGHYCASRVIFGRERRRQGHYLVSRYRSASRSYSGRPVAVRVEYDAQIGVIVFDRLANGIHRLFVLRVGRMVREAAVRLKIKAAADIGAHLLENFLSEKARGTVAGVDNDMHALKVARYAAKSH